MTKPETEKLPDRLCRMARNLRPIYSNEADAMDEAAAALRAQGGGEFLRGSSTRFDVVPVPTPDAAPDAVVTVANDIREFAKRLKNTDPPVDVVYTLANAWADKLIAHARSAGGEGNE